jgi:hypothetical protein
VNRTAWHPTINPKLGARESTNLPAAKNRLDATRRLGNDPGMQPQPTRGRRWRRFIRHNRGLFFLGFLVVVIVTLVGVLFWVMSSSRFVKMN